MSIISDLEDRLLAILAEKFAPIIGPVVELKNLIFHFKDTITGVFTKGTNLFEEVISEYQAIRDFKSKPHWKSRVVSAPRVVDNVKNLIEIPHMLVVAFRDIIKQVKGRITAGGSDFEPEELEVADLRSLAGKFGPKVLRIFEKVLGVLQIVVDAITTVDHTLDDLKVIVDAVKTVREDFENLDGLFLPQNNKRMTIQTDEGKFRIRVGKLHKVS